VVDQDSPQPGDDRRRGRAGHPDPARPDVHGL